MSENETPTMHPDFPRWYHSVNLEDDKERLNRRFHGVLALIKTPSLRDVESMIRIAFRAKPGAVPEGVASVRQTFRDSDELYEMDGNDRELEILCAAALAILLERDGDTSAAGALALTTTSMNGARSPKLPMDLSGLAEKAIGRIANTNRRRPNLTEHSKPTVGKIDFAQAKAKMVQPLDWNGVQAAFDSAAEIVRTTLLPIVRESTAALMSVSRFIKLQDEELQMLWWVIGGRSEDRNIPFKGVTAKQKPLVFAKELADSTEFLPGPSSAKALLARAGLKEGGGKITIPAAVNASDVDWLASLGVQADISPVSMPVHSAIFRKLETGDKTSWISGWTAVTGIRQDYSLSALTLGNLFYRERLLILLT